MSCGCDVCCEPIRQTGITRQPTGVLRRKTYGRVAVDKENRLKITLDSPTMFNRAKNTNVKSIGNKYLIIRGVLCTVIYGSQAHSQNSTCCVPRSTYVWTPGALADHYWSQVDTVGQPNHVGDVMSPM